MGGHTHTWVEESRIWLRHQKKWLIRYRCSTCHTTK